MKRFDQNATINDNIVRQAIGFIISPPSGVMLCR
jgi:hypothetical protein